jgi:hypothetical protein
MNPDVSTPPAPQNTPQGAQPPQPPQNQQPSQPPQSPQNSQNSEPQQQNPQFQVSQQSLQGQSQVQGQPSPKKSKRNLIIAIASVIGVSIVVLITILMLVVYPPFQSRTLAKSFMKNITSDKIDKAAALTDEPSENTDFLTAIAKYINGDSYALKEEEYNGNGESYYLFSLSGGDKKAARVTIEKSSSKQYVKTFVTSTNSSLSLKPGSKADDTSSDKTDTTDATDTTSGSSETPSSTCFAPSDYKAAIGYETSLVSPTSPYTTNVHFAADSLSYVDSTGDSTIESFADIAVNNPGKDYSVTLQGSVATTSQADLTFANQRADKIKSDLVAHGMNANKIKIEAPSNVSDMGESTDNATAKETARVVVMEFYPACSTSTSSSSSSSTGSGR